MKKYGVHNPHRNAPRNDDPLSISTIIVFKFQNHLQPLTNMTNKNN